MKLRPYQEEAVAAIDKGWREYQRQLLVLPTGTGKTVVFNNVAAREVSKGNRVLVVAHYNELLEQARYRIWHDEGIYAVLEKGKMKAHESVMPVVVGSRQSLHRRRLEENWPQDAFDLIIIDEAHHVMADSYAHILRHFNNARVLGVTATPDRADKQSLGEVFENIAYEYTLRKAIQDGNLCDIRAELIPLEINMQGVRTQAGDYRADDCDRAISPVLQNIASELAATAKGRKVLAFLPLVNTSKAFADACNAVGLNALHVDGKSEDREQVLVDFAMNKVNVLCNASLLLEGYDCPDIDCVLVLRPTKSRALYAQMVGRGTRIHPNKTDLLLPDFLWQSCKHDLCVPASLMAKTREDAERMTQYIIDHGGGELLDVERNVIEEREKKLAEELKANRHRKRKSINPLEWALSIRDEDLEDYAPTMKWESQPITEKQTKMLMGLGFDIDNVQGKGHASKLISRIIDRRKLGLCTPRQAKLLVKFGMDPSKMTFDEASKAIDKAVGGWRNEAI